MSNIDTKKEAKKRLENLRDFSNSSMPIRVLLRNEEELKVYEEVMKSMMLNKKDMFKNNKKIV